MSSFENKETKKLEEESSDALVQRTLCVTPDITRDCALLCKMHTYMRPHNSKTERKFIHNFLQPLGVRTDKFGNIYKALGDAPILWSSHTDTVHDKKGMQLIGFDKMEIGLAAEDKSGANCLGADDTAGVWLMMQMIMAKVPGLYVFHRAEENGRKGSQFIAKEHPELLKGIKFAVALDRRGTNNFITYQSGKRCCSDDFGNSFIAELKKGGLEYKLDETGSYTDTASYVDIIGECTNISVGYTGAHSTSERLDLGFIFRLRDALCRMDLEKLVEKRKAGEVEHRTYSYSYSGHGSSYYSDGMIYGSDTDWDNAWVQDEAGIWRIKSNSTRFNSDKKGVFWDKNNKKGTASGTQVGHGKKVTEQNSELRKMFGGATDTGRKALPAAKPDEDDEMDEATFAVDYDNMVKMVSRNPEAVADILEAFGMTAKDLRDEILSMVGVVNC